MWDEGTALKGRECHGSDGVESRKVIKLLKGESFFYFGGVHVLDVVVVVPSPYSFPVGSRINLKSIQYHCHRGTRAGRDVTLGDKVLDQGEK